VIEPPEASRPRRLLLDRIGSPVGEVLLLTDEDGALRALDFHDYEPRLRRLATRHYGALEIVSGPAPGSVRSAVQAYFAGQLSALSAVTWRTNGTGFQRQVWAALTTIPAGEVRTYRDLAEAIGRPAAVRAVGLANGANPVALVAPCHRVVGADGSLTGYGGGLHRKAWLLRHEGVDRAWTPQRKGRA